jgi:hypothetical protein
MATRACLPKRWLRPRLRLPNHVGGSSDGAQIGIVSYETHLSASCSPGKNLTVPAGRTEAAAPHAWFTTSGSVAVLAGIAASGYGHASQKRDGEGWDTQAFCNMEVKKASVRSSLAPLQTRISRPSFSRARWPRKSDAVPSAKGEHSMLHDRSSGDGSRPDREPWTA